MIYLSGTITANRHPQLGHIITPRMGQEPPKDGLWALDNGCFAHPETFNFPRFAAFAEKSIALAGDRCLFIVTPDVPFDAEGTVQRFEQYRDQMRRFGRPVAFVTQDGMGVEDVPWNDCDAVFVGGSTVWKTGHESAAIVTAAKSRGKWVHMGRVNSLRRLQVAASMGCDSADGTFLKYAPDTNWLRVLRWFEKFKEQPVMEFAS